MRSTTIKLLIILIIVVVGAGIYWYLALRSTPTTEPQVVEPEEEKDKIVLYHKEVNSITPDENSRRWSVVQIIREVNDGPPEVLAEVGKVGEYPRDFVLSPDKTKLLIGLESKLQILDLDSKELKDLFTPKKEVGSFIYSPNGDKLLIWDKEYASRDNQYYIHEFNIDTKEDNILKSGSTESTYGLNNWRDDNKVIMSLLMGEWAQTWYFDMTTKAITQTPGNLGVGILSNDGTKLVTENKWIPDICNEKGGGGASLYKMIDPISGKTILNNIGKSDKHTAIVTFSQDDKELLYFTTNPVANKSDCNKEQTKTFYKINIESGDSETVTDYLELLKSWDVVITGGNALSLDYNTDDKFLIAEFYK